MKHEIRRKARQVAFDLFVEALGGGAIECCQLGIEQHALAAQMRIE